MVTLMTAIREPAVAGTFYPNDPALLSAMVDQHLSSAESLFPTGVPSQIPPRMPKAIIAPHAGYIYSGPTAGRIYSEVKAASDMTAQTDKINQNGANQGAVTPTKGIQTRVILLGPSHRVAFQGVALPTSSIFRTPLGDVPLDRPAMKCIDDLPWVNYSDNAHRDEHSLEVHLPFLQRSLKHFSIVPIVVGDASPDQVTAILERLWGGDETLIVVSSDLSHFLDYQQANQADNATTLKIERLEPSLTGQEACGCRPVNGLLRYLKTHGMAIETVDVRNSGDTAGDKQRVVGYGAWRVPNKAASTHHDKRRNSMWSTVEQQALLHLARDAIQSPLKGQKNLNINLELFPDRLKEEGACFVTLNLAGKLRGCIGSLKAHRPLVVDIAHNAQSAAFKDPRFSPLTSEEYPDIEIHLSILTKPSLLEVTSREALLQSLRPEKDGLIVQDGGKRATYLPSVWSQLPDPEQFVTELWRKAGLNPNEWNERTNLYTYSTEEFC